MAVLNAAYSKEANQPIKKRNVQIIAEGMHGRYAAFLWQSETIITDGTTTSRMIPHLEGERRVVIASWRATSNIFDYGMVLLATLNWNELW